MKHKEKEKKEKLNTVPSFSPMRWTLTKVFEDQGVLLFPQSITPLQRLLSPPRVLGS